MHPEIWFAPFIKLEKILKSMVYVKKPVKSLLWNTFGYSVREWTAAYFKGASVQLRTF